MWQLSPRSHQPRKTALPDLAGFPRRGRPMRFSITGGSDVTGSAERAPFVARPFDRLAVGVITVANSPERANENRDAVTGVVFAAGKADKPYCAASPLSGGPVPFLSPDPQTLAGADGRRSTPRSNAAGAKSGSSHRLSLVGPATEPGYRCRKFGQAVTNSHSQVPAPRPADKPEADTLLPSVSGAYSPWAVRRSSNSLRSIYP